MMRRPVVSLLVAGLFTVLFGGAIIFSDKEIPSLHKQAEAASQTISEGYQQKKNNLPGYLLMASGVGLIGLSEYYKRREE